MELETIKKILETSKNTICLLGINVGMDCGCLNYHDPDDAMEIESKYGYSPEELFSASFYNTRNRQFFEYYQKELIDHFGEPDECLHTLAKMEKDGKLAGIITRGIYGLSQRGGCTNVIELHGSLLRNKCPRCGREYDINYMKSHSIVPLCEECRIPIRPQVCLVGEMLDNATVTKAAEQVGKADVLLILGCRFKDILVEQFIKYFNGSTVILINEEEHYSDIKADFVCHGKPRDILPLLYT